MSVNWYWKNELGYMKYNNETTKWKNNLYCANCLGCEIHIVKKERKSIEYNFQGFWNDKQHLKNCLGLSKEYKDNIYESKGLYEIGLNTFFYKDAIEIAKEFAKTKVKVILYYKEVK